MRHALLAVVLCAPLGSAVASGAPADPPPIEQVLAPARPGEIPTLFTEEAGCEHATQAAGLQTGARTVAGFRVIAFRECQDARSDAARMALVRGTTTYVVDAGLVHDVGAHMTDAPAFTDAVRDRLEDGTLLGGARAVVYRLEVETGARCWKTDPCAGATHRWIETVTVCSIPSAVTAVPACAQQALACPDKDGCARTPLRDGVLRGADGTTVAFRR